MQCPTCHSDNVQKLKVIYEAGTHSMTGKSRTRGGGYVYGSGGGFGISTWETTRHKAVTQTEAAKKVAPPSKKSYGAAFFLLLAGFLILKYTDASLLVSFALLLLGGLLGYAAFVYNKNEWPGAYNKWNKSWHCNKCGHIYAD